MLMKVNTCNNEGVMFVVQTSTCTRATRKIEVPKRDMCVQEPCV